jgi:hypothetical protein
VSVDDVFEYLEEQEESIRMRKARNNETRTY